MKTKNKEIKIMKYCKRHKEEKLIYIASEFGGEGVGGKLLPYYSIYLCCPKCFLDKGHIPYTYRLVTKSRDDYKIYLDYYGKNKKES